MDNFNFIVLNISGREKPVTLIRQWKIFRPNCTLQSSFDEGLQITVFKITKGPI